MENVIPLVTPLAYGIKDYARSSGLSVRTLYTLWQDDKGPPRKKVGGRILITHQDGFRWLAEQENA